MNTEGPDLDAFANESDNTRLWFSPNHQSRTKVITCTKEIHLMQTSFSLPKSGSLEEKEFSTTAHV